MKKYMVTVNGTQYEVMVEEITDMDNTAENAAKSQAPVNQAKPPVKATSKNQGSIKVVVPMAGNIAEILVKVGDKVTKGQTVCTLEAMKMINNVPAPEDGIVVSVDVAAGASVDTDAVVATLN